ncbi:tRNA1(Val) (adenine(37)-N6)-methyltransferase [Texcoconibacillus texcoconensis]|uniref:tRNA1(Val) A37 N6-methylase TrmN6 n=1 Tax=Texcoconibacillus texcoconensis TaxID=1095777 RepID=A0A840QUD9_9BACI|nr:tRNA1(Val) (adenine(37)-N6)-methyltransferase [Texcoconibacillus texcoconensis]MBB5174923.1 tRNA1(Val) A37 N6-methylase TrmN6 [Texcoconibacillus texcoconensis]
MVKENRQDYLPGTKLSIVQNEEIFTFSTDAVLLARFTYVPITRGKIIDLCSGSGAIPLLLTERSRVPIDAVELQKPLVEMAQESVQLNHLQEQVNVWQADINELDGHVKWDSYDLVTCNPPYFRTPSASELNDNQRVSVAKHEIYCTLEDIIRVSSRLLKQKGKCALVHRPERLGDLMVLMRQYRLEPKRIQMVHPKAGKDANMVLIEATKDGQPGVTVHHPHIVYNEQNRYTEEFRSVYEHGQST